MGYEAHPSLNGKQLAGVSPETFSARERRGLLVSELAMGDLRQTGVENGVGLPDVKVKMTWDISYRNLRGADLRYVLSFLAKPGAHTFADWRRIFVEWTVAGGQEFALPWPLAHHSLPLPAEIPSAASFLPWISGDPSTDGFAVIEKATVDYDGDSPGDGEAWVDFGGQRFKVGGTLAPGSSVYGAFVPLYTVFLRSDSPQELRLPGREERVLVIEEK